MLKGKTKAEYQRDYMRKRRRSNIGSNKEIELSAEKVAKLALICRALDREVHGLDGKRVNLLTMVRYGVEGMTLKELKPRIDKILV